MAGLPRIALSVRQPWAWAIIHAGKHLENRSQGAMRHMDKSVTHIAIHASKGMTRDEYECMVDHPGLRLPTANGAICPRPEALVRGAIIGHVRVVDRISQSNSPWWCGPRAFVFADATPCEPIAATGSLGFFKWSPLNGVASGIDGIELPKPWMIAWPNALKPRKPGAPKPTAAAPLFDTEPTNA